jgi:hypothetical protein
MALQPFPDWTPADRARAWKLNALKHEIERFDRLAGDPPVDVIDAAGGPTIRFLQREGFWARIQHPDDVPPNYTGDYQLPGLPIYSWVKIRRQEPASGRFDEANRLLYWTRAEGDHVGRIAEGESGYWAEEVNGDASVPVGSVVWLTPGLEGREYLFASGGEKHFYARIIARSGREYTAIRQRKIGFGTFVDDPNYIDPNTGQPKELRPCYEINQSQANFNVPRTLIVVMYYGLFREFSGTQEYLFDRGLPNPAESPRYRINPPSAC